MSLVHMRSISMATRLALTGRLHQAPTLVRCLATQAQSSGGAETPSSYLIQGASRGMGLEFVRQLLTDDAKGTVFATCRSPAAATDLQALQKEHGDRLHVIKLDATDESSIEEAAKEVSAVTPCLSTLINVAGVLQDQATGLKPERSLRGISSANLQQSFAVNTIGPILVARTFMPLLSRFGKDNEIPAKLAFLSARVGSISDNKLGGWYSYRASKAALNQLVRCAGLESERKKMGVACLLLHPGTVDTDLSAPYQGNIRDDKLFTRERAVRQLLDIVRGAGMQDNGRFIAWDKTDIPW
uniref:C-factor n=2 Tax=Auxenochlorella protothecoides TaxID=3075 RepID=A0A1D1ZY67_AUXPR